MSPSEFAKADIDDIVDKLTIEEAVLLTAGVGFWHTHAVPRLGIPAVKVSDGPNGIRGNFFFMGTPAKCLPSATALGATWDPELIQEVGLELLAGEAKLRSASIALAPTCNIQRNPLGGRSFESFSEDPHLSGVIAAAYVRGVQDGGIGACIKHFTANDKENDRMAYDSRVSQRALREVYLMPFMIAERDAKPWSYMTAYNRINGTHCSENSWLIQDVLRKEWNSKATVMSDWFGVYSVDAAINAGLDLEMPGTNKWRQLDLVTRSIQNRKILPRTLKERARNVLKLVQKCAQGAPEVLDGDGAERTVDSPDHVKLMRHVAAASIVLLKNDGALLPLKPKEKSIKKVAVVGGNAKALALSGGGSAALKPSFFVSPYEGIKNALGGDVEVAYAEGAVSYLNLPSLDFELEADGKRGWRGIFYAHEDDSSNTPLQEPFVTRHIDETRIFVSIDKPKGLTHRWSLTLEGNLKPREKDCTFEFGLSVAGRAKLFVDDKLIIDNWTRQRRGDAFFGSGSKEERGSVQLKAGQSPKIRVEYMNVRAPADGDEDEQVMDSNPGVQLGGTEVSDPNVLMEEAVNVAKEADVVIAVVGLNAEWETEGYDRYMLGLPGRTDELVEKVTAANPKTVVVVQSGSAVTYPWADKVPSIVHAWFLGNATGDAIADVLTGAVNPAGKLSMTFPKKIEDVPSYGHFNSENGVVRYSEDIFVGYKHYQHKSVEPLWPFGHGLSYTTFEYSDLKVGTPSIKDKNFSVTLSFTITNTGSVPGQEVAQAYISIPTQPDPAPHQVPRALHAFKKTAVLDPGAKVTVDLSLDKYAVSWWDEQISSWVADKGKYGVQVGPSTAVLPLEGSFIVEKGFEWNGL